MYLKGNVYDQLMKWKDRNLAKFSFGTIELNKYKELGSPSF